jgi:hypothetical protein
MQLLPGKYFFFGLQIFFFDYLIVFVYKYAVFIDKLS